MSTKKLTTEQRTEINNELSKNLEAGHKYAHLIFNLKTFGDYIPSKKARIIQEAINALQGE